MGLFQCKLDVVQCALRAGPGEWDWELELGDAGLGDGAGWPGVERCEHRDF